MVNFFKKGRRIIFELNVPSFNRSCNKSRIINIRSGNLPSTWAWSKHLSMLNFFKKKKRERKPVISRYRFSKINLDRIKIDWQTVLHLPPRSRPMVWRGYGAGASRRCLRPVRSFETSFPGGPPENVTFHVRRRTYAPLLSRDSSRKSPPSLSSTFMLLPAWWKCGENQLCCEFYLLTVCFYSLYRFFQDWKGYGYDDWLLKIGKREK